MFYVNNLDVKQSRQTNDSTNIAKHAKESAAGGQIRMPQLSKEFESVNKPFLSA